MDYQEALASLERGQKQAGMTVKFVPGKTTGGWLSDETRVNLAPVFNDVWPIHPVTLVMGWIGPFSAR